MSSTLLQRRLMQLLLVTWIALTSATATSTATFAGGVDDHPTLQSLETHLAGLDFSNRVEVERLIGLWGHPIQPPDSHQQTRFHDRSPHPRALRELREVFARQVKCGSGTCNSGSCCVTTKEGKTGCCPGRCCTTGCCDADQTCGQGICINPIKYVTSTTTRTVASTTTVTTSVSGTTTSWSTTKVISTVRTTVSNIATATQIETKFVTITETPGVSAARRALETMPPMTAIDLRRAQPAANGAVVEHIYYIRQSAQLDPLADALSKRGLSIERRSTVTSTNWVTSTDVQWSTVRSTFTNWRVLLSTTTSTETTTSTSFSGAATTVTSTTTSTTRILAGTTPTDSPSPSPDVGGANTNDNPSESKPNIAAIAGGAVGGVAAIAILSAIIFVVKRRRHWAEQDAADATTVGRASTLGMPEGNPDAGFAGGPGRGAVADWREPKLPVVMSGTPSFVSGPTTGTGSEMGQHHHPYAPYPENGGSPDPRALSGQWYAPPPLPVPMQQPPPTPMLYHEMGATPAPMQMQQPQPPYQQQHGMGVPQGEQGVYTAEQRNLSGQWYPHPHPQQQVSEMHGGQVPGELPGHGHGVQRY